MGVQLAQCQELPECRALGVLVQCLVLPVCRALGVLVQCQELPVCRALAADLPVLQAWRCRSTRCHYFCLSRAGFWEIM